MIIGIDFYFLFIFIFNQSDFYWVIPLLNQNLGQVISKILQTIIFCAYKINDLLPELEFHTLKVNISYLYTFVVSS